MTRTFFIASLIAVASLSAEAQTPEGPPPSELRPSQLRDTSLVTLLNAVKVLREGAAGNPLMGIRVLASWGGPVEDSDGLRSRVYVTVNLDGDELRAFELGDLFDPKIERIVTERRIPVIYLTYGLSQRLRARVEVSLSGLKVRAAPRTP